MEIFSLDLGNIQTKIKSSKTEKVLPSRFRYYDDLGDQSTSLFDSKLDINEYEVNFDNMFSYAWGTDLDKIKANNDPIDTLTFEDRYTTNEFRLLASFAIGELAKDFKEAKEGILEVNIITGVPTDDFNREAIESFVRVLDTDHNITINGERLNIRVNEVKVLPQPTGTVYHQMLDDEGYLQNEDYQSEHVTVVDCGGGTLLIDSLINMNLSETERSQHRQGAYKVYDNVVSQCKADQIATITSIDVETILKDKNSDGHYYKPNKNESINITKYVEKAKIKYTRTLINTIETTLKGTSQIDTLLFTGGGANLIDHDEVKARFKHAIFVENSDFANAIGFYKYGLASQEDDSE